MSSVVLGNLALKVDSSARYRQQPSFSGAEYLLKKVKSLGVEHAFMVPGKMVSPFLQAFDEVEVKAVVPAHEAGAGFMADGYARASGKFGVCMAIAGPGTANLVPAITAAYADQVPVLSISGSIPEYLEGKGAFQDATSAGVNDVALMDPVTRYASGVKSAGALPQQLSNAFSAMFGVRKSPAYLQVSLNAQENQTSDYDSAGQLPFDYNRQYIDAAALDQFSKQYLKTQARCAILVGQKVNTEEGGRVLLEFADTWQVPVATTLEAKGVFPEDHSLSLGVFGYAGNQSANDLLLSHELDVLLIVGCDISQRNTMAWEEGLFSNKDIVQIDSDPEALGKNLPISMGIVGTAEAALLHLVSRFESVDQAAPCSIKQFWLEKVTAVSKHYEAVSTTLPGELLHPSEIIASLRQLMPRDTVTVVDSGAHRAFAGHYWQSYAPQQYLTSSSLAPMGWAIPASIGAKLAKPGQPCLTITGDGCMLMHGVEIQTAARYNVPVIFVVLNNSAHGGIHLDSVKANAFSPQHTELATHDWKQFANALGVSAFKASTLLEFEDAVKQALELDQPCLIDVRCDPEAITPVDQFKRSMQKIRK